MNMSTLRRLPALVVAASMAWTSGCGIETDVRGITADADIATPPLMATLAHGANLELSHLHLIDYAHFTAAGTDEITNGYNNSSGYRYRAVNQYQTRPDYVYSQTNEAGWVAAYAAERMYDVNIEYGTDPATDPLIAHMYINAGLAMQWLAEGSCAVCVGWGPNGGNLLKGPREFYNPDVPQDSDSIMRTAITWAEKAEPIAAAAIAAGRTVETEPTWEHFIPQNSLVRVLCDPGHGVPVAEGLRQGGRIRRQGPHRLGVEPLFPRRELLAKPVGVLHPASMHW